MSEGKKDLTTLAAAELIRQKVEGEKDELSKELADMISGVSSGTLDPRDKKGRELFLRIMFVSMAESFAGRTSEIEDMDMGDLIDKLLKVVRQLKEERDPHPKGPMVGIFMNQGKISSIDDRYNAVPAEAKEIKGSEQKQ